MSLPGDQPLQKLQFYVTTAYSCGYLPDRMAQSLIAAPQHLIDAEVYSSLINQGFRRSGSFAYRPHCENCHECVPVRIPVEKFSPSRSQKRAFRQHQNLTAEAVPVEFHEEHYALYAAYQRARHHEHAKTDSPQEDAEQYKNFLCKSNVESVLVEFRDQQVLKMVSVIDIVSDGISAVYTFYDTSQSNTSYGTYNIMWQAAWAKQLGLPYLYLGYWIRDSQKMAYKQNFKPLEKLIDNEWEAGE